MVNPYTSIFDKHVSVNNNNSEWNSTNHKGDRYHKHHYRSFLLVIHLTVVKLIGYHFLILIKLQKMPVTIKIGFSKYATYFEKNCNVTDDLYAQG